MDLIFYAITDSSPKYSKKDYDGHIGLGMFLDTTSIPFMDQLLEQKIIKD